MKKRNPLFKRLISLVLCLLMVGCCVPMQAFAADETYTVTINAVFNNVILKNAVVRAKQRNISNAQYITSQDGKTLELKYGDYDIYVTHYQKVGDTIYSGGFENKSSYYISVRADKTYDVPVKLNSPIAKWNNGTSSGTWETGKTYQINNYKTYTIKDFANKVEEATYDFWMTGSTSAFKMEDAGPYRALTRKEGSRGTNSVHVRAIIEDANGNKQHGETARYDLNAPDNRTSVTVPVPTKTAFVYDGTAKTFEVPSNDAYEIVGEIQKTEAGTYSIKLKLKNKETHKWADGTDTDKTITFVIKKADQTVTPEGLVSQVNESISKRADGAITGVTSNMEYRASGVSTYTAVGDASQISNLAAGTYYVRYKGDSNTNASADVEVVIQSGRKLTVTLPAGQVGYSLTANKTEVDWQGNSKLTLTVADGYSKQDDFDVEITGKATKTWNSDKTVLTLKEIEEDISVSVKGVADTTAPNATLKMDGSQWNTLSESVGFDRYSNTAKSFVIEAQDAGSGMDQLYYYISDAVLTAGQAAGAAWQSYNGEVTISPEKSFIVYIKAVDKAGNVAYANSEGYVLDNTAPVITGIEDGQTYYGPVTFSASDANSGISSVKVDGVAYSLSAGSVTLEPNNKTRKVTVTDKAGNVTEYTIHHYGIYNVKYYVDGELVSNQDIKYGQDAVAPAIPTKTGYDKTTPYWSHDGKNITSNTNINAVYTINSYVVNYYADGVLVDSQTIDHGSDASAPTIPAKAGHDQTAPYWDHDGRNITTDTDIQAVYTINTYTVNYYAEGVLVDTQTVNYDSDAVVPQVPAKEGHDQTAPYWDHDGKNITADTDIQAVYTINTYLVNYYVDGALVDSQTINHGSDAVAPSIPAKEGHDQVAPYWKNNGMGITQDLNIHAVYTINTYTVNYYADGALIDTQTIEYDADAVVPEVPAKVGYDQTAPYWDHDGQNIREDKDIHAVYTINQYQVKFFVDGGMIQEETVDHGNDVMLPAILVKEGYDQVAPYWDHDGKNITQDMEITAVFTINTYTVDFMVDGVLMASETVEYDKDAPMPEIPAKENHDRVAPYWDQDGRNIKENKTINAVYTLNSYKVQFVNDGAVMQEVTADHGQDVTLPSILVKAGYDQVAPYWDHDGKNITDDTVITAVHTPNVYDVTLPEDQEGFTLEGGSDTTEHGSEMELTLKLDEGYEKTEDFTVLVNGEPVEVTEDGKIVVPAASEDLVIEVKGIEKKVFTVTYPDANGNHVTVEVKYGESLELPEPPAREGFTAKWSETTDSVTGDMILTVIYTPVEENNGSGVGGEGGSGNGGNGNDDNGGIQDGEDLNGNGGNGNGQNGDGQNGNGGNGNGQNGDGQNGNGNGGNGDGQNGNGNGQNGDGQNGNGNGEEDKTPDTADSNDIYLWIVMMLIGGLGMAATAVIRQKQTEEE